MTEHRYIHFSGKTIELTKNADGLWADSTGCIYGVREESAMTDKEDRIGVWPFVFPFKTRLDGIYKVHDYMYSCPAWQFFHTREESDAWAYEEHLRETEGFWPLRILAQPFRYIIKNFGGQFWDNPKTRLKKPPIGKTCQKDLIG